MLSVVFFLLLMLVLGQFPPGDHTIPATQPAATDFPVLDCSARDSLTSALASCTASEDPTKPDYLKTCADLLWSQGLFATCTTNPTTATARVAVEKADITTTNKTIIVDVNARFTTSTRRTSVRYDVAPRVHETPTPTTNSAPTRAGDIWPPDLHTAVTPMPGYPLDDCPGKLFLPRRRQRSY